MVNAVVDLIKGLAKTRLAKSTPRLRSVLTLHFDRLNGRAAEGSILDAGWGKFLTILSVKAANAGLLTVAVNP